MKLLILTVIMALLSVNGFAGEDKAAREGATLCSKDREKKPEIVDSSNNGEKDQPVIETKKK